MTAMISAAADFSRGPMIELEEGRMGVIASEAPSGYRAEAVTEAAIRPFGIVIIACAYLLWLLPSEPFGPNPDLAKTILSLLFIASGLGLYMFASRGFMRRAELNAVTQELRLCRVNAEGRIRRAMALPLSDVQSIYVQRGDGPRSARLMIRIARRSEDVVALRGPRAEIEAVHARLSGEVRTATAPRRINRPTRRG